MDTTGFRKGRDMRKAWTYFVLSFLVGVFAIFLREGKCHVFREWLNNAIEPERRTLLEHFLSGFAAPLAIASFLALVFGAGLTVCEYLSKPERKRIGYLVSESTFFSLVFILATLYFFYACYVEGEQSVEKFRDFQWDQWLMDLAGCSTACFAVYYLVLKRGWGRVRSKSAR